MAKKVIKIMGVSTDTSKVYNTSGKVTSLTLYNAGIEETDLIGIAIETPDAEPFDWELGPREQLNEEFTAIKKITITNPEAAKFKIIARTEV